MDAGFSVPLGAVIKEFQLESLHLPQDGADISVTRADVNRCGLQLAGFFDYFDADRIQILGKVENSFLERFTPERRMQSVKKLFSYPIPAVIVTREIEAFPELVEAAREADRPLLRTKESTSAFTSALFASLNLKLAPRIQRHGVLVEVYGEGMLLLGESGVGKSETAMELVKRGHRLIADDAVVIKRVSAKTLVGTAPEVIRHFIELRGIGVVDVRRIFGMGAIKETEKIDLVVKLESWDEKKMYDRLGVEDQRYEILGLEVPMLEIPIKPGRNLAIILEVAAMNNRLKRMGYSAAEELSNRIAKMYETDPNSY